MFIYKSRQSNGANRLRFDEFSALLLICLLLTTACSHTTAYIRPDTPKLAEPAPPDEQVNYRLFLIGDAGEPAKKHAEPVLKSLADRAGIINDRTAVIFLGDNIYPAGLPVPDAPQRAELERKLVAQIEVMKNSGAQGIFVPGNHDWNHGGEGGQAALKRQEEFVENELGDGAFLPVGGCPGPVKLDFDGIRLIVIDTQWWLHKHEKPISECFEKKGIDTEHKAKEQFIHDLTSHIASAGNRQVVIVAHHPLATHGPHGGFFDWKDHIFPLTELVDWLYIPMPVIGSLYPLIRWQIVKSDQDLAGSENKKLVHSLTDAISKSNKPVIYAAGHDHALQVLQGDGKTGFILISGLGSEAKASKVGHGDDTLFAHVQPGFMELDFLKNGNVYLRVFEQKEEGSGYEIAFSSWVVE
ncbi:MAG: metallophosphoesterase [bacterium]